MARMILGRLRDLVIVLFIVGSAMFLILRLIPGSPAIALLGQYATQDQIDALNERMGFDRPLFEQYLTWLGNIFRGDLGDSFTQGTSVVSAIAGHAAPTLVLAITATVLSVAFSIPLAIQTISRPRSVLSRVLMAASSLGLAIPGFWLALILVLALSVGAGLFPVSGYVSPFEDFFSSLWYLTLPIIVILSHQISLLVMTLRESLAGEMLNAYIRTAHSKGVNERGVFYRHLLPNALLPAVTVVGSNFGTLLGGIVILETVFLIPGIGWLLYGAIQARDYNLILGVTMVTAFMFVVVNLIVDIVYGVLDPRVRTK